MTTATLSPRHAARLHLALAAGQPLAPGALEQALQASRPTVNRALCDLLACGFLDKRGSGQGRRSRSAT
jgi:predicted transcriptional regulator